MGRVLVMGNQDAGRGPAKQPVRARICPVGAGPLQRPGRVVIFHNARCRTPHVFHLHFLPKVAGHQRGHREFSYWPPPGIRLGQGSALGGVQTLRAVEPFAARNAVGINRGMRAGVPRDPAPCVHGQRWHGAVVGRSPVGAHRRAAATGVCRVAIRGSVWPAPSSGLAHWWRSARCGGGSRGRRGSCGRQHR